MAELMYQDNDAKNDNKGNKLHTRSFVLSDDWMISV